MAARMKERGSGHGFSRYRPMADINVTPFVDVMLVLLVVFMVTAPLLTVGVQVDLPKTKAPALPGEDQPLAISINSKGEIFLQEAKVEINELVPKLTAITEAADERRIFVRGDQEINYGRVLEVMGTINAAGFRRVALVAQPPRDKAN